MKVSAIFPLYVLHALPCAPPADQGGGVQRQHIFLSAREKGQFALRQSRKALRDGKKGRRTFLHARLSVYGTRPHAVADAHGCEWRGVSP